MIGAKFSILTHITAHYKKLQYRNNMEDYSLAQKIRLEDCGGLLQHKYHYLLHYIFDIINMYTYVMHINLISTSVFLLSNM